MNWTLSIDQQPVFANAARRMHHQRRAAMTREWRGAGYFAAKQARIPKGIGPATVVATAERPNRRNLPDTDAHHPTVKAVIDGLVDAGLWPDDSPAHVTAITYRVAVTGRHALTLTLTTQEDPAC